MKFDTLTPFEGCYFYRTACFSRQESLVSLVDIHNLKQQTLLNNWFGQVYSLADGQHTVGELFNSLKRNYNKMPPNLRDTLVSVLYRMVEGNLIKFSDSRVNLPYHVSDALNELDIKKARASYDQTVCTQTNCDFQI